MSIALKWREKALLKERLASSARAPLKSQRSTFLGKNIMHALHELHLLVVMSCQYEYVLHLLIPDPFFLSQVSPFM